IRHSPWGPDGGCCRGDTVRRVPRPADEPTTEGVIAAMRRHDFGGHHVGVQLYPRNPNRRLMDFIDAAGAVPDPVLPYVYVSEADDSRGLAIINGIAPGPVYPIAFSRAPHGPRPRASSPP